MNIVGLLHEREYLGHIFDIRKPIIGNTAEAYICKTCKILAIFYYNGKVEDMSCEILDITCDEMLIKKILE